MAQENATANGTDGTVSTGPRPPQVRVIVQPPIASVDLLKARERSPAAVPVRPSEPARQGELARSVAGQSSNRRFGRIWYVPVAAIHPTPTQLRKEATTDELRSLAHSIREKGMTQPVLLRCRRGTADAFELIAGYRRWRAARLAGLAEVPALVIDRIDDREALELALVENLQRRDLTVLEEAEAFRLMIEEHGQTHEQIAALTGRSRSHVSNILRLLSLPAEVREMIGSGRIGFGHARALLGAASPGPLATRIAEEQLTVRETERIVSAGQASGAPSEAPPPVLSRPVASPPSAAVPRPRPAQAPSAAGGAPAETAPADAVPDEVAALQTEIAQELGSAVEIRLDEGRPEIRIQARSPEEAAAAARTIRDALQLLNMSRAMRRLAGSGRPA